MPANTVMVSQMMRELSAQPGVNEELLETLRGGTARRGPAILTPKLFDELRKRVLGNDWSGLDRFPGWTMPKVNATVDVINHVTGKDSNQQFLDIGPYALDQQQTINLNRPSTLPGFTTEGIVTTFGHGIVHGDGPNALAPEHAESQRFAYLLNRLAANTLEGVAPLSVTLGSKDIPADTPEKLLHALQTAGYTITVTDSRYFANFTHLHYNGQDVMAPFWIDSQMLIPDGGGRHLLVPVTHAELEWQIRSPQSSSPGIWPSLNVDVSYYFGDDGKSEWRVMDTLDQPWVLKRNAHTWTGNDALEVTRLTGRMTAAYMRLHAAHPHLPFGGYYTLGVCQDGVAAIEHHMTGKVTLFPNTADASFFNNPRDQEINRLIAAIPKDRDGAPPEPERIFGSLPTADFDSVTIPGLSADLKATHAAWQNGSLQRTHDVGPWKKVIFIAGAITGAGLVLLSLMYRHRHNH